MKYPLRVEGGVNLFLQILTKINPISFEIDYLPPLRVDRGDNPNFTFFLVKKWDPEKLFQFRLKLDYFFYSKTFRVRFWGHFLLISWSHSF